MASQYPFVAQGKSFLVAANATAPTGVQITAYSADIKTNTLRLFNDDANQTIYVGFGTSAADAKANAVIPVAAGNSSIGVPPRTVSIIRVSVQTPQLFVSGITATAAQANLIVTPGDGI